MKPTHTSLFARATRYSESAKATPRENRLTECFAGVLERVEGLAVDLAVSWLDPDSSSRGVGEVSRRSTADLHSLLTNSPYALTGVRTQIRTSVGKFVDLELRFGSPEEAATDIVVWVEVKHGTGLHDEQALSYRASLRALHPGPHDMPVVILGRQSDLDPYGDQVPDDSPLRSWDRVGGRIRTLRDEPELFDDPVDRWLMQEFLTFLREEGLMPRSDLAPSTSPHSPTTARRKRLWRI
ncbi:MAG: hypothetical protein H0V81_14235 [Solirubrobacterales bacterium]|nr:hypothetical protein [Solirubrobacterales bacterium]